METTATSMNSSWCDFGHNNTTSAACNITDAQKSAHLEYFEMVVRIVVPIIFGFIAILGFVGNLLVIMVVVSNKQMRNTTNALIINLAVADLFFIVICVPFTATGYVMPIWPFGNVWCKIYQYTINVTAYSSVYTLVFMSLDRYLAVVHPLSSMTIRTVENAYIVVLISWVLFFLLNLPVVFEHEQVNYNYNGDERSACINVNLFHSQRHGRVFYGCFFMFAYVIPLVTVCVLYGFMVKRLLYGVVPGGSQSAESLRSKKRVTRMVIIVIIIFALCWLPIHIILMIQHFGVYPDTTTFVAIQIASNCLAYMNSCVNPILYAFLSDNFRKSFRRVLCGYSRFQPVLGEEMERTNARGLEPLTRTSTALNNNGL